MYVTKHYYEGYEHALILTLDVVYGNIFWCFSISSLIPIYWSVTLCHLAPEFIWLYYHMKRICMKRICIAVKNLLCAYGSHGTNRHSTVFIFAIFLQIFAIFCLQCFFLVQNGEPLFRYQLQYLLIVFTWIWKHIKLIVKLFVLVIVFGHLLIYGVSIWQKIRFNIKCTGEECICHHFQLLVFPCLLRHLLCLLPSLSKKISYQTRRIPQIK